MNYREFESTRGRSPEEKSFYYHVDVMQAGRDHARTSTASVG